VTKRVIEVELPLFSEIEREAVTRGQTSDQLVAELLDEGFRMRRVRGIVFADGPVGRRATVAGTGVDVWEVISMWKACGENDSRLAECYDWLTEDQLTAALVYFRMYPAEIEARLEREASLTPERVYEAYPFLMPKTGGGRVGD
jgi:uncharacterized protein (DUF433 family)